MLGLRLRHLRGKRTQEEIAMHIGISRGRYSHYENGRSEPDTETLQKLADFFKTTTDYLLGRTDDPRNSNQLLLDSTNKGIKTISLSENTLNILWDEYNISNKHGKMTFEEYIEYKKIQNPEIVEKLNYDKSSELNENEMNFLRDMEVLPDEELFKKYNIIDEEELTPEEIRELITYIRTRRHMVKMDRKKKS